MSVDVIDAGHDALLELLFGGHADVAQDGSGELGEESFDEIEPGAVRGREGEVNDQAVGLRATPWFSWTT